MMLIGVNTGRTAGGKRLKSGAAAVVDKGVVVFAIAEERLSREKEGPGHRLALAEAVRFVEQSHGEIDAVGISTCCEDRSHLEDVLVGVDRSKVVEISHHRSHAAGAFLTSRFREALVLVMDGGGNTYGADDGAPWWAHSRDQHSYFVATESGFELIGRDFFAPRACGVGELFRAFSHYLGWRGSRDAGRVMALAAKGDARRLSPKCAPIWLEQDGSLRSIVENTPPDPVGLAERLLLACGIDDIRPIPKGSLPSERHADVAAFLQRSVESAVVEKVRRLLRETGQSRVCVGGGVALNCVLNGAIWRQLPLEGIHVCPVPGDDGQAMGNALFLWHDRGGERAREPYTPFLGPSRRISGETLASSLGAASSGAPVVFEVVDAPSVCARLLERGNVLAWYQARGEYGPRALGARSVLSDPRSRANANRIAASLKTREHFLPFAPSVLEEHAPQLFVKPSESRFMGIAFEVRPEARGWLAATMSDDGSARAQTVPSDSSAYRALIDRFYDLTGIPALLNTSFNRGSEPIVETLADAAGAFTDSELTLMAAGRYLVVKRPAIDEVSHLIPRARIRGGGRFRDGRVERRIRSNAPLTAMVSFATQCAPDRTVFVRTSFALYVKYIEWLREGRKCTTVRFRRNGIEIPATAIMDLFRTPDFGAPDSDLPVGKVEIGRFTIKPFGSLSLTDARNDGFVNARELRDTLQKIYGAIPEDHPVTIYDISRPVG